MRRREDRRKAPRRRAFRVLLAASMALFLLTEGAVVFYPTWIRPEAADAIVVLGAQVGDAGPRPVYASRLKEAARLYREGYAPLIVTTGGRGPTEPVSEGEAGRAYLIALGVPPEAVLAETASSTTLENLLNARALYRETVRRGENEAVRRDGAEPDRPTSAPGPDGAGRMLIVSSRFHLFRAMLLARCLGIPASYAGAVAPGAWPEEIVGAIREVPAIYLNAFRCLAIRMTEMAGENGDEPV
ncbi:MAG: YdcF family protein [Hydrogenibacillus schlegelii]|uniref:YdcF family protein n=1 Tax=Hydrogenibacillus schlegelii TaxID=1484 RepID=A0A947D3T1_HYDSH|nr:YdcF family protein [Hydrogenibacillus schlegelii]